MTGKRVRFHPETDFTEKDSTLSYKRKYHLAPTTQNSQLIKSKRSLQRPEMCDQWVGSDTESWPLATHCDLSQLLQPNTQAMTCSTVIRPAASPRDMLATLPTDPRDWTKEDVVTWLRYMQRLHHMSEIDLERFSMNGKALCLMNAEMFTSRVPNGGNQLYRDFRFRLSKAMIGCST